MTSPAEPLASASIGAVRDGIDPRRFPWIRPLATEYSSNFARVASLFAGNPTDPSAWRETIARVSHATRDRAAVRSALDRQLTARGAPRAALDAAAELSLPTSVAVVTGQQAGVFGGPLYTLLKAVTTVQLARQVRDTYGVPAVPVFWVEVEDHDWAEIRSARILDAEGAAVDVTVPDVAGAGRLPVSQLRFEPGITDVMTQLGALLPPTEFTREVVEALGKHYRPGRSVGTALAGWMDDLLGHLGLVVFEAGDPSLKPLVADLFARELADRPSGRLARQAGAVMTGLGHAPQVEPAEDSVGLFYLSAQGRQSIRAREDRFLVGDAERPASDVIAEATAHPERFSPNVLMRPIIQDRLFPTVCYVAGPAELAYQAQIGGAYREFGVEAPLLYQRASATLVDAGAARFLDRSQIPLEALQPQDDSALNRLLERALPADVERAIVETDRLIRERIGTMKSAVVPIDPTLAGAVDTTIDRMAETLKSLQGKVIQAAKRKDDTLRRQFTRTRALVFPGGDPQERALSVAFFVNRYGLALGDRLVESLPLATDKHYILAL